MALTAACSSVAANFGNPICIGGDRTTGALRTIIAPSAFGTDREDKTGHDGCFQP